MSINFSTLQGLTIPDGVVTQITDASGRVLWMLSGGKVILEVEKITSDTYAGETTYTGEQFILLDIYPKTNGTVKVTYGGLTKTITDTSGAEEPNAQQVFFGTFNGVSDSVATPASGELTIDGDYYAFACGSYQTSSKVTNAPRCVCVTAINSFGKVTKIPDDAFFGGTVFGCKKITAVEIPDSVISIGKNAFAYSGLITAVIGKGVVYIGNSAFDACYFDDSDTICSSLKTVKMLGKTPPELEHYTKDDGTIYYAIFGTTAPISALEQIIVPKGCGEAYKTATGWSTHAYYIVEES